MRAAKYKLLLDRLASYLQEADGLSDDDSRLLVAKINLFVRLAWEYYWWPGLTVIERRTFRPAWNAGTAYAGPAVGAPVEVFLATVGIGDFADNQGVYYQALQPSTGQVPATLVNGAYVENGAYWALSQPSYSAELWQPATDYGVNNDGSGKPYQVQSPLDGNYYQCLTAHTSGGSFDPAQWGLLTPFTRSIAYDQVDASGAALTPLGEVRFIWDRDPQVVRYAQLQKFRLREEFVQVLGVQNVVWVEFRLQPATYVNTPYDATLTYAAGVQLYDPETGENWVSKTSIAEGQTPTASPSSWTKVPFPYAFLEYVALSAYAALTNREQANQAGQVESFTIQQAAGFPLLLRELDKIERQQGQVRQMKVVTGKDAMGGWWYRS